ncbi:hypothetical protein GCM10027425_22780 [Alteromonas gracilis]
MTSEHSLDRRVRRLENDTAAIYEILGEIQTTQRDHTARLGAHDRRFDAMDQRFDAMDRRFDRVDGRLGSIDETLAEVLRRLPAAD